MVGVLEIEIIRKFIDEDHVADEELEAGHVVMIIIGEDRRGLAGVAVEDFGSAHLREGIGEGVGV